MKILISGATGLVGSGCAVVWRPPATRCAGWCATASAVDRGRRLLEPGHGRARRGGAGRCRRGGEPGRREHRRRTLDRKKEAKPFCDSRVKARARSPTALAQAKRPSEDAGQRLGHRLLRRPRAMSCSTRTVRRAAISCRRCAASGKQPRRRPPRADAAWCLHAVRRGAERRRRGAEEDAAAVQTRRSAAPRQRPAIHELGSLDDVVDALIECLVNDRLSGPVNVVAPIPVTNSEFTKTLGRVLAPADDLSDAGLCLARWPSDKWPTSCCWPASACNRQSAGSGGYEFKYPQLEAGTRAGDYALGPARRRLTHFGPMSREPSIHIRSKHPHGRRAGTFASARSTIGQSMRGGRIRPVLDDRRAAHEWNFALAARGRVRRASWASRWSCSSRCAATIPGPAIGCIDS